MKYKVYHRTLYTYDNPVSSCHSLTCLSPAPTADQIISEESFTVSPQPDSMSHFCDAFGNRRTYFNIPQEHNQLEILSAFTVDKNAASYPLPGFSMPWKELVKRCEEPQTDLDVNALEFLYPTDYTEFSTAIHAYALESFTKDSTVVDVAQNLCRRIFEDFTFDNTATEVESKPHTLLDRKRGVCQDFAHFYIACMRSLKIPCKYISGYILTYPPDGQEKLFGADASHAWVSTYCPMSGWVEMDPTNNLFARNEHIKIAEGRDYHDVAPVKGVFTGNTKHKLEISVDVSPLS